uniref:CCDC81 HU domain-containing protein n=1 Tax=Seriola dumerili TaxID=41447 RepID=A0A3B4V356_SERDU
MTHCKEVVVTYPVYCFSDIDCIWADVSAYTERQMTLQKGVRLAGLGTFTFSQQKLDLGNKFTVIQRPIFLLAGKLVQSLGLKQTRPLAAVVQLNFAAVSQEGPFSRDVVEGCIRETLLLLFRALASEQNVFVTFQGIGVLSFKNNKVRMKFNSDFINAMDGTGRLLLAFKNVSKCMCICMLQEHQQAEEKAQEKLLLIKEQQRDKQCMEEEQVCNKSLQPHNNMHTLHETSFIFPARPLTPAKRIQQHRYMNDLQSQIESRRQHEAQDQQNRLLMEHLDQVQLVQEIALKKAQHLQQKQERTKHYKTALDTQFVSLCLCFLSRLILDRINRFEKKRDISKSLEDEWSRSVKLKHQQEEDERRFLRCVDLLVDKLAQYRRCRQCKRRTSNFGESNIWKDSHYLSGSQFMI